MKRIVSFIMVMIMCFSTPISVKASNGMYVIETSFYDSFTGEQVILPNAKGEYYVQDGSVVTIDGTQTSEYYDSSREYLTYDSYTTKPVTMKIKEDSIAGWQMEEEFIELEWIYDGGMYIASPKIYLIADDKISTISVNASIEGKVIADIEMVLRRAGETEALKTAYTDATGVASFGILEMGEYEVYCPSINRYWYISPETRGEVNAVFKSGNYQSVLYLDSLPNGKSSVRSDFKHEVVDEEGNVIDNTIPYSLNYTEGGNEKYYISTISKPDGYTGKVLDHQLIVPYQNYEYIKFMPDLEPNLLSISHNTYFANSYDDHLEIFADDVKIEEHKNILSTYKEGIEKIRVRIYYQGTSKRALNSNYEFEKNDCVFSDVNNLHTDSSKVLEFEVEEGTYYVNSLIKAETSGDFTISFCAEEINFILPVHALIQNNTTSGYCEAQAFLLDITNAGNSITIEWENENSNYDRFIVNKLDNNGNVIKAVNTKDSFYKDTDVIAGETYRYRIDTVYLSNVTSGDETIVSSEIFVITAAGTKPDAPVITLSNNTSSGKNVVKWKSVLNAEKYEVYRATSKPGTYSLVKTTTETSYTDTKATAGNTYYYKVRAIAANGTKGEYSSVKSRVCDCAQPVVTMSNVASSGKNKLSWKTINGATSYKVYRAASKTGTYSLVKTTTGISYTDTTGVAGKTYYYKVKAYTSKSADATSAYSVIKNRTCDLKRPVVKITLNNKKPKVSWGKISGAKSYKVYRSTSKTGSYSLLKTTTVLNYRDAAAKKGQTYYYKVIAVSKSTTSANSAYSLVKSIKSN